jgi:hypothetical protein
MSERERRPGRTTPETGEEHGRDERLHQLYAAAYPSLEPQVEPSERLQRRVAERVAAEKPADAPIWLDRVRFRDLLSRVTTGARWKDLWLSVRPVAFTMAAAFLVTWLPLRLAETGRLNLAAAPAPRTAAAPPQRGLPQQPEWLAGAARLALLLQGERSVEQRQRLVSPPASPPRKERQKQRSSVREIIQRVG